MDFDKAKELFDSDHIQELASTTEGLRFLKLRSLSRKEHLITLFERASIAPKSNSAQGLFREAFQHEAVDTTIIEGAISQIYNLDRKEREETEQELVNQLYRLDVFDWGGLHQNNLERTIVDNYIKTTRDYDQLSQSIENELHHSMRGYVLCSWYNHWTSIIIEDIFRDHPSVLPAVGLVKRIDFFVKDIPFDLKVTYLPEGYIKYSRRRLKLRPELTLLKRWARGAKVPFTQEYPDAQLLPDLWKKADDHPSTDSRMLLDDLVGFRLETISNVKADPLDLIRWLYENQGERRFDASNRLFLVLVDQSDFFGSWKLKRAKPLLHSAVSLYLDAVSLYLDNVSSVPGRALEFKWRDSNYSVISDAIVVTKPQSASIRLISLNSPDPCPLV